MGNYLPMLLLVCILAKEGTATDIEEVEELLKLEREIDLVGAERLILLIGSTGTGKSTLAKLLIDDPSLQIVKVGRTTNVFKDNGTISNNIRKSMTILPNVYRDPRTREIIVDCPGFSDTREPKYEIANAFFIKKVLETPAKLKIVLTENHFSLVEGSDRFGFNRLLLALAELIPNIERFRGSLALVSTKAFNRGSPEDTKSDLVEFLANYKSYLEEDLHAKTNQTVRGMMRVLDVITGHPPGDNVAFFWRPVASRQWTLQELMNDSKTKIRSLVFDKLSWADNRNAVYHYSLSKESRLFIKHTLAPSNTASAIEELLAFFANLKSSAQAKIFASQSAAKAVDFMKSLHTQLSIVSTVQLEGVNDISNNVTQRLAAISQVEDVNADVLKYLATKASFFKAFGVDVVARLNTVLHKELESLQRWLSENLQNAEKLLQLEERMVKQAKEAAEARESASRAAKEAEERHAEAMAASKRALEQTEREAAARVADAERARKAADEEARRSERETRRIIESMEADLKRSRQIVERMAAANNAPPFDVGSLVGGILNLVGSAIGAASAQ